MELPEKDIKGHRASALKSEIIITEPELQLQHPRNSKILFQQYYKLFLLLDFSTVHSSFQILHIQQTRNTHTSVLKMQISFAVVLGLLATSISATPTPRRTRGSHSVRVQLTNDLTGCWGSKVIPLDNKPRDVVELFGDTRVVSHGQLLASSVQLTKIARGGYCSIKDQHGALIADINHRDTFEDLDGDRDEAKPRDMRGTVITCGKQ
ncbi:hypothetical protein ACJ73_02029 [Blastomyces percursus]|uniref:Uncharacterized protein n=1 Tax=Blastomyces percursus TaxID=1658174 RepID=A0A1J9QCK9_9EURO|nr:hypothetical protein ACJ73_02029 [Blastomyces percursus]